VAFFTFSKMKKERRITKNEEFQEIIKNATYASSEKYVVYFRNRKENNNRVGISVGKKLGKAVDRNKIKRQLRMMVQETEYLSMELDFIIIVRKGYLGDNYDINKKCLENMLKKVKIRACSDRKGEMKE